LRQDVYACTVTTYSDRTTMPYTCLSSSRWYRTSGLKLRLAVGEPLDRKRFGVK